MSFKFVKRSFFQRVIGAPATQVPEENDCWDFKDGKVTIALDAAPELKLPNGAIRLEGRDLPIRILVVHSEDGQYRAYHNRCTHIGHRRLDPVPGTNTVQCCSISKSTFDSDGDKIHGPAVQPIKTFSVEQNKNKLIVSI